MVDDSFEVKYLPGATRRQVLAKLLDKAELALIEAVEELDVVVDNSELEKLSMVCSATIHVLWDYACLVKSAEDPSAIPNPEKFLTLVRDAIGVK